MGYTRWPGFFTASLFLFSLCGNAQDKAEGVRTYHSEDGREITIEGWFLQPRTARPGNNLLSIGETTKNPLLFVANTTAFSGRTGEKTFEIEHKWVMVGREIKEKSENTKFYFVPNDIIELPGLRLQVIPKKYIPNCKENESIKIKVLKLEGNSLTYQIIPPGCLKSPD